MRIAGQAPRRIRRRLLWRTLLASHSPRQSRGNGVPPSFSPVRNALRRRADRTRVLPCALVSPSPPRTGPSALTRVNEAFAALEKGEVVRGVITF
jgi:hypothetical protein